MVQTVGSFPSDVDVEVYLGEPVDFTVPVLDAAAEAQDLAGWTLTATAYRDDTTVHTFTATAVAGGVQLYASAEQTATWAGWAAPSVRWSLWLTPPASPPYLFAAGWVRLTTH